MKKTKIIVVLVIASILLFGNITLLSMQRTLNWLYTEQNTTEFSATVTRVHYLIDGYSTYCVIDTQEFPTLNVSAMKDVLDWKCINEICPGDKVHFRVANLWLSQLQFLDDIPIITLGTAKKEYVSLEDYANYARQAERETVLRLGAISAVLVVVDVQCILLLNGKSLFRRRKR